jgi:hypothetical protein
MAGLPIPAACMRIPADWSRPLLRAALGDDGNDPAADRIVTGRLGHVADIHCYPRVTLDVRDLLVALDSVEHDVLAVGVDPGLGHLG